VNGFRIALGVCQTPDYSRDSARIKGFSMTLAYIGLGANVGDRAAFLSQALALLEIPGKLEVLRRAGFYETEPVGNEDQPWFLNTVAEIDTVLSPHLLLAHTQWIERRMGRLQREPWGPREIDLDILLFGDQILDTVELKIPHPELHRRRFVLVPMCELAPQWMHPISRRSMRDLLTSLDDTKRVKLLAKRF
jgi:2-amino-4-hydroxy-6-hydroxymethyldihydropteridine diphosphokinase